MDSLPVLFYFSRHYISSLLIMPESNLETSIDIASFFPLPMAGKGCGTDRFQQTLLFLLRQSQQNQIQVIRRNIGDGHNKVFVFEVPFNVVSWRITNQNDDIIEPDVQIKPRIVTIFFGVAPAKDEFKIEILGVAN